MYFANTQTEYRYSWQVYVIARSVTELKPSCPKVLKVLEAVALDIDSPP
jgi:hypothetical protein